jgi:secondary thiamine-phosphate synthase enzyme
MKVHTERFTVSSRGDSDVIDITPHVAACLERRGVTSGLVTVFVTGSTASVTTTEYEPGLRRDIPEALDHIAPRVHRYHHDDTWHDGNGHSHVRAAFIGPSLSLPVVDGELTLGTWQQVVLIDHDTRPREREIVVQIIGEA